MLWLLLLSGSALKWAGLTPRAQHLFAVAQIFLSSGVVAAGIAAVVFSTAWGSLQCQVWHTHQMCIEHDEYQLLMWPVSCMEFSMALFAERGLYCSSWQGFTTD